MLSQLRYNILNAQLRTWPYPHVYVPNVFPADVYAELQRQIPDPKAMIPIAEARPVKGYKERFVQDISGQMNGLTDDQKSFWHGMARTLRTKAFRDVMVTRFRPFIAERFKNQPVKLFDETLLVEDITHYSLGPHTDTPAKVVTVLFYLPKDDSQAHLGTSLYVPKHVGRTCPGGPHYIHEDFERAATMPFLPNSMFAFVKSDVSFHGVEPVTDPDVRRWLLLYDIKAELPVEQPRKAMAKEPAGG
jgi:hypothetical protein